METYSVRVSKDYLVFCSAHFITYDGATCERLHGHNYRVAAEIEAPLDTNHYVFDFIALKNIMRRITDELDHRVLLPTQSALVHVDETGAQVRARFEDREWTFPREDCVLLPIENTTAELLARWIAARLCDLLASEKGFQPRRVGIEVEESFGQLATYEYEQG